MLGPELITLIVIFFIQNVALGAIYGRMDGGGVIKTHEWTERSLIMFYFVAACIPFAGWWAILAYAGVAGIATGHGQYFLAMQKKPVSGERFDFIVRLFFGDDPRTDIEHLEFRDDDAKNMDEYTRLKIQKDLIEYGKRKLYWRNVFGMAVTGFWVGLPAALLAAAFGAWPQFFLFLLTGPVKAAAYAICWAIFKHTEQAEYANGGGRTALALAALLIGLFAAYSV